MHLSASWSGARLRSALRLVLGALLGAVALAPDFLDLPPGSAAAFRWTTVTLWVLLVGATATVLVGRAWSRDAWREVLPSIVLLAAVLVAAFAPIGVWSGEIAVVGISLFYVLELRVAVPAQPALYASLAIGGVVLFACLAMADSEAGVPGASIQNAGDSLTWAAAQIFRAGSLVDVRPVTDSGQFLGFIVLVATVFFAAVLFSAVTAWAVREKSGGKDSRRIRDEVQAALAAAGLIPVEDPAASRGPEALVIVDVDDVVGRMPRTWLRSREGVMDAFVQECSALTLRQDRLVIAVIQGDDDNPTDRGSDSGPAPRVVATRDSVGWVAGHARPGDIVVTGRRGMVAAARERDAQVCDPRDWRSAVGVPAPTP